MDEIEDAVTAGVHAGDHAGPGHRTLRRDRGGQAAKRALLPEMIQVRQIGEVSFHKNRIHAVDAEHDHPLSRGPRGVIGARRSQQAARAASDGTAATSRRNLLLKRDAVAA